MGVLFMAHYINFFGADSRDLRQHVAYLAPERGRLPPAGSDHGRVGNGLPWVSKRGARREAKCWKAN
jgi:hypothetical protein